MYSIQTLESVFTSVVQPAHLKKFSIELYGWNRTKEDKSDPEMIPVNPSLFTQVGVNYDGSPKTTSVTNQKIGMFGADVPNWERQCYQAKMNIQKEEVGIGMRVTPVIYPDVWSSTRDETMYLSMIDFNPGLDKSNRHTLSFWEAMEGRYPGKKLYLFNSGNAHHALMNTLMDECGHAEWMQFLSQHEEVVDQKWVKFAGQHSHGGVIRTTSGRYRPQPKLWKWVNL